MENKGYRTVKEQILSVMNMDNLKQEVQLNQPFELDLLLKVSIDDLLNYGADVTVPGDFSLSYHQAVMKLREQLKENVMEASEFVFTSVSNRELWISWYSTESGVILDYDLFMRS